MRTTKRIVTVVEISDGFAKTSDGMWVSVGRLPGVKTGDKWEIERMTLGDKFVDAEKIETPKESKP